MTTSNVLLQERIAERLSRLRDALVAKAEGLGDSKAIPEALRGVSEVLRSDAFDLDRVPETSLVENDEEESLRRLGVRSAAREIASGARSKVGARLGGKRQAGAAVAHRKLANEELVSANPVSATDKANLASDLKKAISTALGRGRNAG